ncbi:response regulator with CheY-like receiver, AAA-type ATPase, and DNA-binding domains [Echinicola vietnamensis DSM 17526]|uniref:Response regulator with CheY-like receiver, AAA-type ATPase, and DNA-binding domains n=2 Tax=Echinicola TaxID=390846 RepID=L0G4K8_ECHVK|nr:response regulator with CheY-like receiver, AAA-type ATPase, and DNA-binding domains [Echinicola vietnamensis DSM 17526]
MLLKRYRVLREYFLYLSLQAKVRMKSSLRIAIIYILVGGSWVTFSSLFLDQKQEDLGLSNMVIFEVVKAVLFVLASGLLIYLSVERSMKLDRRVWEGYEAVFDNIPISMWVVDRETGKIINSNNMAGAIFGGKIRRKNAIDFESFFGISTTQIKAVYSAQNQSIKKCELRDRNGETRMVDLFLVPFHRDRKAKFMVAAVDNTSIHQNMLEKEILNASLKEQNDRLRKFAFMNSHNLRRPLSNVLGMVNFIKEDQGNKEILEMLRQSTEELDEEVRRMNEILADEMVQNQFDTPMTDLRSKSILIVDDDKVQHLINKRLLLKNNPQLDLYFFANPIEALLWLEEHKVDLLLLDINMPEMKGWDFLDQLIERKIEVEVRMLSSSIDPRDEDRSRQYDMVSGFLVKPLKKESLEDIL